LFRAHGSPELTSPPNSLQAFNNPDHVITLLVASQQLYGVHGAVSGQHPQVLTGQGGHGSDQS